MVVRPPQMTTELVLLMVSSQQTAGFINRLDQWSLLFLLAVGLPEPLGVRAADLVALPPLFFTAGFALRRAVEKDGNIQ